VPLTFLFAIVKLHTKHHLSIHLQR